MASVLEFIVFVGVCWTVGDLIAWGAKKVYQQK